MSVSLANTEKSSDLATHNHNHVQLVESGIEFIVVQITNKSSGALSKVFYSMFRDKSKVCLYLLSSVTDMTTEQVAELSSPEPVFRKSFRQARPGMIKH